MQQPPRQEILSGFKKLQNHLVHCVLHLAELRFCCFAEFNLKPNVSAVLKNLTPQLFRRAHFEISKIGSCRHVCLVSLPHSQFYVPEMPKTLKVTFSVNVNSRAGDFSVSPFHFCCCLPEISGDRAGDTGCLEQIPAPRLHDTNGCCRNITSLAPTENIIMTTVTCLPIVFCVHLCLIFCSEQQFCCNRLYCLVFCIFSLKFVPTVWWTSSRRW